MFTNLFRALANTDEAKQYMGYYQQPGVAG